MRKNKLKEILKSQKPVACGWLHIPNSWTAEVMANAGWDCVTVDMQHGPLHIDRNRSGLRTKDGRIGPHPGQNQGPLQVYL